jgi:gluconate kinase
MSSHQSGKIQIIRLRTAHDACNERLAPLYNHIMKALMVRSALAFSTGALHLDVRNSTAN